MSPAEAKALLPEILSTVDMVTDWTESRDTETQTTRICSSDPMTGEIYPLCTLAADIPFDDRQLMRKAVIYMRAMIVLREEAARQYRALAGRQAQAPKPETKKDFAAEASMKCTTDQAFRRYLIERHDLQDAGDAERVKSRVRSVLAVSSLKQLNDEPDAGARWVTLRNDFKSWLRER